MDHRKPIFDLSPLLTHLRPPTPPPPPPPPEPVPAEIVVATCTLPFHRCGAPRMLALRRAAPLAILHFSESASIRLIVHSPLELTPRSRAALLDVFAKWAWDPRIVSGHRAEVGVRTAHFVVPQAVGDDFLRDVLDAAAFQLMPL